MMTIDLFINRICELFPALDTELDNHKREYGEILYTVFLEDDFMPMVVQLLQDENTDEELKEIFVFFEVVSIQADDNLLNIFSTTVLEVLGDDRDILSKARKYMGPRTTKLQREADIDLGR